MNEDDPKKPVLRVLPENEKLERLEHSNAHRSERSPVQDLKPEATTDQNVEVLQPDYEARLKSKKYEPDVAEILDHDEIQVDSEAGWGGLMKKYPPIGWFVLAGIVIGGLAIWAAVTVFQAQPVLVEVQQEKKELIVDKIKEDKEVRQTLDRMRDCVRGYLTAKTVEEKLVYVRHPERVKPLIEDYYQRNPLLAAEFRQFERLRSMGLESLSFVFGRVELLDGNKYKLLLEQLEDGTFRVDWESDVCYLPVPWAKYINDRPTEAMVMRVYIKPDTFYAYEFRDEKLYECYHLTTRDSDDHVFGFVKKGSDVAMDIKRFLKRVEEQESQTAEPVMLLLRFPEDSHSKKCVWIERMIAPRWTYVKSPDTEAEMDKQGE